MDEATGRRVSRAMIQLGIPMRLKGWEYLRDAIRLAVEEPSLTEAELFRRVAVRRGMNPQSVKNSCSGVVTRAYDAGFPAHFEGYLPHGRRLAAGAFITLTAEKIRRGEL